MTDRKIVLVKRATRLEELVARFNTREQARFYLTHSNVDFDDYEQEDLTYQKAHASLRREIEKVGRFQSIDRGFLPNFLFGPDDVVIALGQDGVVANTLKYLHGQPLLGVNPDPRRWDGVLLPFGCEDVASVLPEVLQNRRALREVTMAQATLNNGQSMLAVNDLFIGPKSHTSARYQLCWDGHDENHSSSGIIISTGLGSTGWLKSIVAGARGVSDGLGLPPSDGSAEGSFPWERKELVFVVREPYPSRNTAAETVFGRISDEPLKLISQMPENGVIFSDGMEGDFLEFNSGTIAEIGLSPIRGQLVQ